MGLSGKVVFSSGKAADFDIWSLDIASGKLTQLTTGWSYNDHPKWSPDGSLITFTRAEDDGVSSIWVMDPDGKNQRKITDGIYCLAPTWHPDNNRIIFTGNGGDRGELSICSVSLDGSGMKVLFDAPGIESCPSVTPDGEAILFAATPSNQKASTPIGVTDIMEYRLDDGSLRALHSHPAHDYNPACSPDGERIVFTSHRNGRTKEDYQEVFDQYREVICKGSNAQARKAMQLMKRFQDDGDIFVSNREGTHIIQLTDDHLADRSVCWSPCGNFLMYTTTDLENPGADRLKIIHSLSGESIPFTYDRSELEREIGADTVFNRGWLSRLTPDAFERLFAESSFWGAERNPDWTKY